MCIMKKLLVLLLSFLLVFIVSGCGQVKDTDDDTASKIKIVLPADDTVNGYRQDNTSSVIEASEAEVGTESGNYYVNTKTKKFHKSTCYYAKTGSQNGEWSDSDKQTLLSEGYSPCAKCSP